MCSLDGLEGKLVIKHIAERFLRSTSTVRQRWNDMEYYQLFEHIGDFGVYQLGISLMLGLGALHMGEQTILMNFVAYRQDHWCKVPALEAFPHAQQKYVAIPLIEDSAGGVHYDKCNMYDLPYANYSLQELRLWNRSSLTNLSLVSCQDGWTYDQSVFASTVTSKWDLVCDKGWKVGTITMVFMIGMMAVFISGYLSDRFGRQRVLSITMLVWAVSAIASPFIPNYVALLAVRLLSSACTATTFTCGFILLMEVVGPKKRVFVGICYFCCFSLGIIKLTLVAYLIRDEFFLQVALAGPMLLTSLAFLLVPESPRWLAIKCRYGAAETILRRIAKVNGGVFPADWEWTTRTPICPAQGEGELTSSPLKYKPDETQPPAKAPNWTNLLKSPILTKRLFIMCFNWFAIGLVFYGFTLNAASFGSVFLNTFLAGLVEIPSAFLSVVAMNKAGRRLSGFFGMCACALASFACTPLVQLQRPDLQWLLIICVTLGKGSSKFLFGLVYVYAAELFPTPVRQLAVGLCSASARVGAMVSPFMGATMMALWAPLPTLIYGILSIVSGGLLLLLPDTLTTSLPDNLEEAEAIGRPTVVEESKAIAYVVEEHEEDKS